MLRSRGFTLLEVLVTLTIISVVTSLAMVAFPTVREEEALIHARQNIISALRAAQTQALDEQRSSDCLNKVGAGANAAKLCSDVGIFLRGQELITFADTHDDNQYDDDDFRLRVSALPRPVIASAATSFLIEATPPNVTLWHNGVVVPAGSHVSTVIRARTRTKTISLSSYGVIEN